jgi:hypothetical protein
MPRPSKASCAAVRVQQNLKIRRVEEAAARVVAAEKRTESIRLSLLFIDTIQADLLLSDADNTIVATRVFFDLLIDAHDILSSEYIPLLTSCLERHIFSAKGNPNARFALKYTGFYAFVLLENDAMKALSFVDKCAAIDAMWDEKVATREFENACKVFFEDANNNSKYYHVFSVDVRVQMSMEFPSLFLDDPDEELPLEVEEEDKRVQDMRLIKVQYE